MFDALRNWLGQDVSGYAQGPMLQGNAGVPITGINYGDVLKKLGLSGASSKDQQDMKDVNDISQLISLWGGGLGGGDMMSGGGGLSGLGGGGMMGGVGSTMMQ